MTKDLVLRSNSRQPISASDIERHIPPRPGYRYELERTDRHFYFRNMGGADFAMLASLVLLFPVSFLATILPFVAMSPMMMTLFVIATVTGSLCLLGASLAYHDGVARRTLTKSAKAKAFLRLAAFQSVEVVTPKNSGWRAEVCRTTFFSKTTHRYELVNMAEEWSAKLRAHIDTSAQDATG